MNDNRLGGFALIFGAVSGIVTMLLHPVAGSHGGGGGAHVMSPEQFEGLIAMLIGVHALAIAGVPFSFLGALALTRRLDSPARVALTGLAVYGVGLVAIIVAPAMSGLVGSDVLRKMVGHVPGNEQWPTLMEYNHMINQAFARIFVVASCAALFLWSWRMLASRLFPRSLGIYGLCLGPALLIAMVGGALQLDVHGFGLIVVTQAVWFVITGICLVGTEHLPVTVTMGVGRL